MENGVFPAETNVRGKVGAVGICGWFSVEKVCGIPQKTPWDLLLGCGSAVAQGRGLWIEKNGKIF